MKLVIVESPAKCKKIEGYLGQGYKCRASFGHIYQLSDIEKEKNYNPKFKLLSMKGKYITNLRTHIKKASEAQKIFAKNAKVITGSRKSGFVKNNVEHLQYKNKNFLNAFMADLLARDISSVLVEGGQETLNAFIANNLFDELVLYTAPIFLGKKSMGATNLESPLLIKEAARLKLEKLETFDGDIKATYIA
jgi:riboflavin biosynthesis pyrimidine reductase